jgi:hypothetical protein
MRHDTEKKAATALDALTVASGVIRGAIDDLIERAEMAERELATAEQLVAKQEERLLGYEADTARLTEYIAKLESELALWAGAGK